MNNSDFKIRLKDGISQWMKLNLFLLLCMLILRVFFYFEVHTRIEIEASQFANIMKGFIFDLYLFCHIVAVLAVPFLVLHYFFPKTTGKVYTGLIFAYVVVAAILTEYYCNLSMPLDHVILVYTPEEVKGTASSSANITATPFLWFFATLAVVIGLFLLWRKVKPGFVFSAVLLLLSVVVALCVPYKKVIQEERYYDDHATFCLAVNQPSYSYVKISDYLKNANHSFMEADVVSEEVLKSAKRYQKLHPEFHFKDLEYPFFRDADDPDVLGGFFNKTSDSLPPNFVFIIVESLGQRLTGVDFPVVSFTPFIDSLKQEGLYWKNCLSSSERTFGVLPGIFASAPYGKAGFSVTGKPMPNHNSLLRDMINNGYGTSYYYGGVHEFDRFDGFLKANKMDFIYVPDMQQVDSATYAYLNENHRWGLDDAGTIQYAIDRKTAQPSPRPNIDIIMTLTTHEPFFFMEVDDYLPRVQAMVDAHPEMSEKERTNIVKNPNIFACYLYMDDCVRKLMSFYQSLPEYENTIFVITGDHRMGPLNFSGPLNKYNVPLVICSPLLREPKSMDAVVSHLDITPTFSAYLSNNYDYHTSEQCHWMGTSLDTTSAYRNTRMQAFMLNNRDVVEYVDGDYFIANKHLYKIKDDLLLERIEDKKVQERLSAELNDFNVISQFAVQNDHLNLISNPKIPLVSVDKTDEVLIDPATEYSFFVKDLPIKENYEFIFVDLSFDLQSLDTVTKLPFVVVKLGKYYSGLKLETPDYVTLNTGNEEHYHYHLSIPMEADWEDELLKVYLYNNKKGSMRYYNLKVNVSAVR